jgi:hypothetical protein
LKLHQIRAFLKYCNFRCWPISEMAVTRVGGRLLG